MEAVMMDVFFKWMGLGSGKSLQSRSDSQRATQKKSDLTPSDLKAIPSTTLKARATAARRQDMKAPAKKSKVVSKPTVKAKSGAKTVVKPVAKAAAKLPIKPAAKTAAKKLAKPTLKSTGKPTGKAAVKPSAVKPQAHAKPAVKGVAKPPALPSAKAKASVKKTASQASRQTASKSKVAARPNAKSGAAPVSKVSAALPVKPVRQPVAKTKPTAKSTVKPVAKPATKSLNKVADQKSVKAAPPLPEKTHLKTSVTPHAGSPKGRAGSRVVPSYAPSAANMSPHGGNTAAKASFVMSAPVLAPPPQLLIKKDPKLASNWKTKSPEQLTNAEVIAMPDSEYMNAKQLAFFRLKLVALKEGILSNAGETTEHLREDTTIVPDPADRATIEEEHALELRTRDRERKLLKKIEQSIQSIDAEEYGFCDETGEPIGVARLIARPTATLSIEAQQRRELKQKMFGD
jgi:DnaK suppressor protein